MVTFFAWLRIGATAGLLILAGKGWAFSAEPALDPGDELIFRNFLFQGLSVGSFDLPWYVVAMAPAVPTQGSNSELEFRQRWTALATAFNN